MQKTQKWLTKQIAKKTKMQKQRFYLKTQKKRYNKKRQQKFNVLKNVVWKNKKEGKRVKVARPEGRLGHSDVTHLLPIGSGAALSYDLGKVLGVRFFGQKLSKKQRYGRSGFEWFCTLYGGFGFG